MSDNLDMHAKEFNVWWEREGSRLIAGGDVVGKGSRRGKKNNNTICNVAWLNGAYMEKHGKTPKIKYVGGGKDEQNSKG